ARVPPPVAPAPLPARGRKADPRGGPPRQEATEEARPWCPQDRAGGRRGRRRRGGDRAWLLCRRTLGLDRRRPGAVGGLGTALARAAVPHRRQPGARGGAGRGVARGVAETAAVAATWA